MPTNHTFYTYIRCLQCRSIISGYACGSPGEPCDANNNGYFRPYNNITRGQISKVVSNSAGFFEDPGSQIYTDVPATSTFYQWINRLSHRGFMGGYPCGLVPEEPCDNQNRPYFRWQANASRGQLSKIVSNAAGFSDTPVGQTFEDVPPGHPFYVWIERLTARGVMGGYTCGGVNPETGQSEPCVQPFNRPYFRPFNLVSRGQASKIVANTFFPDCYTPARP